MMYKRVLVVPSKGRAGKSRMVEKIFPVLTVCEKFLLVEPAELEAYQNAYQGYDMKIVALPDNNRGIGYARRFAQELFKNCNMAMVDDDVSSFRYRNGEVTLHGYPKIVTADPNESMKALFEFAEQYGFVGMSASSQNFMMDGFPLDSGRIWNAYALTPKMREANVLFDDRLYLFEDFDFQAQAIAAGFVCPIMSSHCFETHERIGHREGGCQSFDREQLSRDMSTLMLQKWGALANIKPNKKSGRPEPHFRWKKLKAHYESIRASVPSVSDSGGSGLESLTTETTEHTS